MSKVYGEIIRRPKECKYRMVRSLGVSDDGSEGVRMVCVNQVNDVPCPNDQVFPSYCKLTDATKPVLTKIAESWCDDGISCGDPHNGKLCNGCPHLVTVDCCLKKEDTRLKIVAVAEEEGVE